MLSMSCSGSPQLCRQVHCKVNRSLLLYIRHLDHPPPIRLLRLVLALLDTHSVVTHVVAVAVAVVAVVPVVVLSFS